MHLANATRTRLGSREKGGGRWLGGVGLGVPRGSRGARRAGGSPGHWLLLLPVAPSVLAPESGPGERSPRCPPPAGCARPDGRDADLEGARARGREARGKRAKEGRQEARSGRGGESR